MTRRISALLVGIAIVAGISSCGGSQSQGLDRTDASPMLSELEQIRGFLAAGSCISAGSHALTFLSQVQALPPDTDPQLKQALENGAQNLTVLLEDPANCSSATPTTTSTTTPSTTTTVPTTTPTTVPTTTPTVPTTTGSGSGGVSP